MILFYLKEMGIKIDPVKYKYLGDSIMKIHHIGYLVKDIYKSKTDFENLGYQEIQQIAFDSLRQINISFVEKDGYVIELISPANKESEFNKLLKRFKNTSYHICYESDNFELDIKKLEQMGYLMFKPPEIAPVLSDKNVCFLINLNIGMIELLEK